MTDENEFTPIPDDIKSYKFLATKDHVDSLKLEASILSPKEEQAVKEQVSNINNIFRSNYEQFIPKWRLKANDELPNRILVTDPEQFGLLWNEWGSNSRTKPPKANASEHPGGYFIEGRISVLNPKKADWWDSNAYPLSVKQKLIEMTGSEEAARQLASEQLQMNVMAHEVIHQYQDFHISDFEAYVDFIEAATNYYHMQLAKELDVATINENWESINDRKYYSLLDEFGDDVHRIFFGEQITPARRDLILSYFNSMEIPE